jgi:hypothetical protein
MATVTKEILIDLNTTPAQLRRILFTEFDRLDKKISEGFDKAGPKVKVSLLKALQLTASRMETEHGNPWPGTIPTGRPHLHRRSGEGLRSIQKSIKVLGGKRLGVMAGFIGAKGAIATHEEEKSVSVGGWMTIPLPAAMNSAGIPLRKKARDWDNTFVAKGKRGGLVIYRRDGRDVTPLYLLVKQFQQGPKLGLGNALAETGLTFFQKRMVDDIFAAVNRQLASA